MYDIRKIQEQALFEAVKTTSDDETASKIVYGEAGQACAEDNAAWVKSAMNRLENRFDRTAAQQIRMNCQCGYGMDEKLALLKELMDSSAGLEEFANQDRARAAGLFCRNGELYLQFPFCPCPMLAEVDKLYTDTWCQCTTGYSKVLFEKAFGCEVEVELLKSIKMGDDVCLQKIIPHDSIRKQLPIF
jgi:predicted hydrocarbon binding protein